MSDTHETIADIIAGIRRRSDEAYKGSFNYPECQENQIEYDEASDWADRLEAALKRELSKNTSKNGADFGQLGDAAKLRVALETLRELLGDLLRLGDAEYHNDFSNFCDIIDAALSAPPRNCDEYTSDELKVIFNSELASELPIANEHEKNLVAITAMGVIDTLLAPATEKEGGAK